MSGAFAGSAKTGRKNMTMWTAFKPVYGQAPEPLMPRPVVGWTEGAGIERQQTRRAMILWLVRSHDNEFRKLPDDYCMMQWRRWQSNKSGIGNMKIAKAEGDQI